MAKTSTSWQPGQSGNPNGRRKGERALTQALRDSLNHTVELPDGKRINGKRYLADIALQAITTGRIELSNGSVIELSPDDMLMFWKFYFTQIDGPPPQKQEHSGPNGEPIRFVEIVKDYGNREDEA